MMLFSDALLASNDPLLESRKNIGALGQAQGFYRRVVKALIPGVIIYRDWRMLYKSCVKNPLRTCLNGPLDPLT